MQPLRIGLYGKNGHQLLSLAGGNPYAKIERVCGLDPELPWVTPAMEAHSLEELLADPQLDLISLCSPSRAEQAEHAIQALRAGKHVYAEKPAALSEEKLDEILCVARENGKEFREMGGTAFGNPYWKMRELITQGEIGEVVQVFAQKSYPYYDGRPQSESLDGGLLLQVGVHAARWIEHVTGLQLKEVHALESGIGNPGDGDLRMAASFHGTLKNGAIATATLNYLNPFGFGKWGNDHLRIFGTKGMLESTDAATRTRFVVENEDRGPIVDGTAYNSHFDLYARSLLGIEPMPLSLEDELHPLRILIRAKTALDTAH